MNTILPIEAFREEIVEAVSRNDVTIIQAETGAGKTTQVPQFLVGSTDQVIVTQPRKMAAISIAQRVAEETGTEIGGFVGYKTSTERLVSEDTKIIFCTDGLEMMRSFFNNVSDEAEHNRILVIDEVHEWNLNLETLIAWIHHKFEFGFSMKVVIMSASMDADMLESFFDEVVVETIKVPGRTYPISERRTTGDILRDTITLLEQGHNVLVFQPGKVEIYSMIRQLEQHGVNAEILPLHGGMPYSRQVPCFSSYNRPKCVISTNIAETSVTISDIDAVVDSGLEKRTEVVDGVEGLYTRPISLVNREQRKGRAGRTKPGIYIDWCPVRIKHRSLFTSPEILSRNLESVVLRLAATGLDAAKIAFYHKPSVESIDNAKRVLRAIGCLNATDESITRIGRRVAHLPVSARVGRMLDEASYQKHIDDRMLTLAAIVEDGSGLTNRKGSRWQEYRSFDPVLPSDLFVQVAAFEAAMCIADRELDSYGINRANFLRVLEIRNKLADIYRLTDSSIRHNPIIREQKLVQALCAGLVDRLYKKSVVADTEYKGSGGNIRELPQGSAVRDEQWIVGMPWSIQIKSEHGPRTLRLLTMATSVNPEILIKLAPWLVTRTTTDNSNVIGSRDSAVLVSFNGLPIAVE